METPERSKAATPIPATVARLWRPSAQRNMRNQWSNLASYRSRWVSASSSGRSHATSIVNAYLSQKYMDSMELGVLNEMPDIIKKASFKLLKQQDHYQKKLLLSYKNMISTVNHMMDARRSMRCYAKGPANSPIAQFASNSEDNDDDGDGGGIPVFTFYSVSSFEQLADELIIMFTSEVKLKRMIIMELLSISCETPNSTQLCWSNEFYSGEFDDLSKCNMYSEETCQPVPPRLSDSDSDMASIKCNSELNQETLQVYLTAWLAEVNLDINRHSSKEVNLSDNMKNGLGRGRIYRGKTDGLLYLVKHPSSATRVLNPQPTARRM